MDVAWIGHAAFRLRGRDAAILLDPCPSSTGFRLGRPQADIVTVSNPAPEHSWHEGVAGASVCVDAPGEYEIHNVLITGVVTNPPAADVTPSGSAQNVAFVVTIDDIVVAHLGDLRAEPSTAALEELSRADVLLIPVGGNGHLDAKTAVKVVGSIDPRLVIPMLYKVGPEKARLDGVEAFLSAMGGAVASESDNHVNVTRAGLGEHTVIQVLAPRGD